MGQMLTSKDITVLKLQNSFKKLLYRIKLNQNKDKIIKDVYIIAIFNKKLLMNHKVFAKYS